MQPIDIRQRIHDITVFEDLTKELDTYKDKQLLSQKFIVDSDSTGKVKIILKYPGKKKVKRKLRQVRVNSLLYENVYDFLVEPYLNSRRLDISEFTYKKLLDDFEGFKRNDDGFWKAIVKLYEKNHVTGNFSYLGGLNYLLFLYVLKWLWIQEDLNYKYNHNAITCPTRYKNTKTGVGRGKFFAALLLVKSGYFTARDCIKITSLY